MKECLNGECLNSLVLKLPGGMILQRHGDTEAQAVGEGNDLRERKENKELMLGEFNHKWTQMGTKVG